MENLFKKDQEHLFYTVDVLKKEISHKANGKASFFDVMENRNYSKDFILGLMRNVRVMANEIDGNKKTCLI